MKQAKPKTCYIYAEDGPIAERLLTAALRRSLARKGMGDGQREVEKLADGRRGLSGGTVNSAFTRG